MGQFISFKSKINNSWFNPWFILLHTHSNVCATVEGQCLEYLVYITLTTEPHLMSTFAFLWKCRFKQCSSFSTLHLVLNHFYLVSIKWGNQFLMQHLWLRWFQRSSTFLAKLFHCRTFAIKFLLGKVMPFFDSFHLTNVRTKGDEMFPLHVGLKTYFKVST